ncbi:hypothetical protein BH10BAC5_BH10BAC5_12620 [soil metagenome]
MKIIIFTIFICFNLRSFADERVKNTSYVTNSGEKVLRLEVIIPETKEKVWEYLSNPEKLKKWIAPVVSINLKTGGYILTNYDSTKAVTDPSSIRLGIINYLDNEMLTLKVDLNDALPESVRSQDENLQEIIQLIDIGGGKTKLTSSMIGWGNSNDWDKTYNFFVQGNIWTYEQFLKLFQ